MSGPHVHSGRAPRTVRSTRRYAAVLSVASAVLAFSGCAGAASRSHRDRSPPSSQPPRQAFAPTKLLPISRQVITVCTYAQSLSPHPILCPGFLPRATIGWPRGTPAPSVGATDIRSIGAFAGETQIRAGVSLTYGSPVEPGPGQWKPYLWLNRPCCLLHFVVLWIPPGKRFLPAGSRPATLAGIHGWLRPAQGYGLAPSAWPQSFFWANHVWFTWIRNGIRYTASLHEFGEPQTTKLLSELIGHLKPAESLARTRDRASRSGR